jgi:hypothetical protein
MNANDLAGGRGWLVNDSDISEEMIERAIEEQYPEIATLTKWNSTVHGRNRKSTLFDKARQYDQTRLSILADALEEAGCPTTRTEWLCESLGTHHHDGQPDTIIHGLYHAGDPRKNHHHHDDKCNRKTHTYPLISHLRSPGPHPTGCHVMDLLLTLLED